jgi:hypothetical protein
MVEEMERRFKVSQKMSGKGKRMNESRLLSESPESNRLVTREWKWCSSREQRTCEEVCLNNLRNGKCIKTGAKCKVKPNPMSEEDKIRLQSYRVPRQRTTKGDSLISKIKEMGAKRVSTMLYKEEKKDGVVTIIRDVSENTVRSWIKRESVPIEYHEVISAL